jgi:tetratricopeptide (TPR) repeat protein
MQQCWWPLGIAASLVWSTTAFAEESPNAAPPDAAAQVTAHDRSLELFRASEEAFRAADFRRAVELLLKAYALFPEPVLLYDLARAYEGLGEAHEAAAAYERYLAADPHVADRPAIEQRVRELRRPEATAREPASAVAPATPRATPPAAVSERRPSFVVLSLGLAATGAVLIGGGIGFSALASDRHDAAVEEPIASRAEAAQQEAERLTRAANVSLIAGGAFMVAGATLAVFELLKGRNSSGPVARLSATPSSVALQGSF